MYAVWEQHKVTIHNWGKKAVFKTVLKSYKVHDGGFMLLQLHRALIAKTNFVQNCPGCSCLWHSQARVDERWSPRGPAPGGEGGQFWRWMKCGKPAGVSCCGGRRGADLTSTQPSPCLLVSATEICRICHKQTCSSTAGFSFSVC